ncbi:RCC1 domain-containing protein 1-like, partial [Sinocyclocheilus rhinocerous]|uniref:RCC1 domain-containing protein 1-like n=1 Tax=Sinocyclocheilus rhinocerous TaxID=307959 RepID=UPI0007B918A9
KQVIVLNVKRDRSMNWFGFGFDGFGQIRPADVSGQVWCKVSTPVLISDVCRSDCSRVRVRASWSSRADVHHTDLFLSGCFVSHGQLGHGALASQEEPQVVEALWGVPIRAVSAGSWHSASVSAGGDLYMWGWNESGQLGLPSRGLEEEQLRGKSSGNTEKPINEDEKKEADVFISIQALPALVDVPNVSEISRISCGSRHTAAVTGTGDLYTWGWGHYGQLGHGTENSTDEPTLVDYFPSHRMCVKDVICGLWNTFVSAVPKEQPPS